jgi:hypothetical protein
LIGFPLDHAAPGSYELVMTFKDEISGSTLEIKEPFAVQASDAATPVADKPTGQ